MEIAVTLIEYCAGLIILLTIGYLAGKILKLDRWYERSNYK